MKKSVRLNSLSKSANPKYSNSWQGSYLTNALKTLRNKDIFTVTQHSTPKQLSAYVQ